MPKSSVRKSAHVPSKSELKNLVKRYGQITKEFADNDAERMKIAAALYEAAIKSDHAELHVTEHRLDRPRAKSITRHYKLSDPKAALLLHFRFCNIWVPVGQLFCIKVFGCAPVSPPPPGFIFGCVLIGCFVNVCPAPGAGRVLCVRLCI